MHFIDQEIYHIYNRGNFKQKVFFDDKDYRYFIKKIKKHLAPICDIMSWSLMPNHFHFQIHCNEESVKYCAHMPLKMQKVSAAIKTILSSYTKKINTKYGRYGNLFKQKTQSKLICDNFVSELDIVMERLSYATTVFHYIHLNPLVAKLVTRIEDWKYSSYNEYYGTSTFRLCNKKMTKTLLNIDDTNFLEAVKSAFAILYPIFHPVPSKTNQELRKKPILA